jgi:hypothetical protein
VSFARPSIVVLTLALAACGKAAPPEGAVTYDGDFTELEILADSGRIEVTAGEEGAITVTTLPSDGIDTVTPGDDGTFSAIASCVGETEPGCGVGFLITVPPGVNVVAKTGTGEIAFVGGLEGDLDAQTASGAIRADGLGAAKLSLLTGTGGVETAFAEVPRELSYDTGSSAIDATVPSGTYTLDLDSTGVVTVGEGIEDGSGPTLRLHSGAGAVTVTGS